MCCSFCFFIAHVGSRSAVFTMFVHVCMLLMLCCFCFSFKLPSVEGVPLSRIFGLFEEHKAALGILEYSLSQTSLEQIFNLFASQQEEETGGVRGFN